MDPMTIMAVSGMALNVFGGIMKSSGVSEANQAQQQEVQLQIKQDQVRRAYMETDARRKNLQVLRSQQQMQAMSLNNAVTQGAQFGSGLAGGMGQISGQANTNMLGINQNLYAGRQMFDLNQQIDQQKIMQLQGQQDESTGSGISSMGNSLIASMPAMKQLTGGFNMLSSASKPMSSY